MIAERIGLDVTSIRNLVIGSWVTDLEPAVVEFSRVAFGIDNRLDGQEQEQTVSYPHAKPAVCRFNTR